MPYVDINFGSLALVVNPLTAITVICCFGVVTHLAIHQTYPDKFLTFFNTHRDNPKIKKLIMAHLIG